MTSVAPAARVYFQNLCKSVLPDDAYVWYGKRMGSFSAPLTLQIYGWKGTQEPAELAPNLRREENFDINCCLSSFAGDMDFASRETEVMAQWSKITTALGNDATLGNIVRWAQITEYEFVPDSNIDGKSIGSLEFNVNCQQRIESMS
jgi:hypothetical protein